MASILKKSLTPRASTLCISHPCSIKNSRDHAEVTSMALRIHRGFRSRWMARYLCDEHAIGSKNHLTATITMDLHRCCRTDGYADVNQSVRASPWAQSGRLRQRRYDTSISSSGDGRSYSTMTGPRFTRATEQPACTVDQCQHRRLVRLRRRRQARSFRRRLLSESSTYGIAQYRASCRKL